MNSKSSEAEGVKVLGNREKGGEKQGMNCYSNDVRAVAPIYKGGRPYISERAVLYMRAPAKLRFFKPLDVLG